MSLTSTGARFPERKETVSKFEITKEYDEHEGLDTRQLIRKTIDHLQDVRLKDLRKKEVDGPRWNNLRGPFYVGLFLEPAGLRLETFDVMPHGIPRLTVRAAGRELALALLRQLYATELHERLIVRDRFTALKESAEADFQIVEV